MHAIQVIAGCEMAAGNRSTSLAACSCGGRWRHVSQLAGCEMHGSRQQEHQPAGSLQLWRTVESYIPNIRILKQGARAVGVYTICPGHAGAL